MRGTLTPGVTTDATGGVAGTVFFSKQKTAYEMIWWLECRRVLFRSTVTVSDGHGGTASQLVTITINGTNEAPTISAHTDGAVTERSEERRVGKEGRSRWSPDH